MLSLGLDLGTTGIRCAVFDANYQIQNMEYIEYPLIFKSHDYVEQDADLWFEISKKVIKKAISKVLKKEEIEGISISSQGISIVPVDKKGHALMNAISWLDSRGAEFLPAIKSVFSPEEIKKRTGKPFLGVYTLPKLLWLKKYEPELFHKADYFLMPMDYLICRFTGKFVTDYTMASGTMLYNIQSCCWDQQIADSFGINLNKLPKIQEAGTCIGNISKQIQYELGLPQNLKIFVGGQDQKCAALAAGLNENRVTISLGTSGALEILSDRCFSYPNNSIATFSYLFKDFWVSEIAISTAGAALRWFNDSVLDGGSYANLDREVEKIYPSDQNLFFFPELAGTPSKMNISANGVFWGLQLVTNKFDMVRSIMESIAFEIVRALEEIKTINQKANFTTIRLFGGGANSRIWRQMITDATGMTVELLSNNEMAATGAAMLTSVEKMSNRGLRDEIAIKESLQPDPLGQSIMQKKYELYLKIRNKIYSESTH